MTNKPGFIALISVLIIAALGLTIGTGMLIRAIGESSMTVTNEASQRAHAAATVCAELALMNLKNSLTYAGNEMRTIDVGDTCRIGPTGGSGNNNRTVTTTSTVLDINHAISITVDAVHPTMQVSSWQDVIN